MMILDHTINEKTMKLLNKVKCDFPNKKILIHPLCLLEKETGLIFYNDDIDLGRCVVSSEYVAVYIRQDLIDNELFNMVLAHELLHLYQVMNGINVISNVNQYCKYKLNKIQRIMDHMNKVMMDIQIDHKLKILGYDLTTYLKRLINHHVKEISNTETENIERHINMQNNIVFYFMQFYRCWYISQYLYELNDIKFEKDIMNFYERILTKNNLKQWKSLLPLTETYPLNNNKNYDTITKEICRRLLKCTAYLTKIVLKSIEINLVLFDLIPRNKYQNRV